MVTAGASSEIKHLTTFFEKLYTNKAIYIDVFTIIEAIMKCTVHKLKSH